MIQTAVRSALKDYSPIAQLVGQRIYVASFEQASVLPALAYNLIDMQSLGTFGECKTQKGTLEIGVLGQLVTDVQTLADHIRTRLQRQEITTDGYTLRFFGVTAGVTEYDPEKRGLFMPLQVRVFATKL